MAVRRPTPARGLHRATARMGPSDDAGTLGRKVALRCEIGVGYGACKPDRALEIVAAARFRRAHRTATRPKVRSTVPERSLQPPVDGWRGLDIQARQLGPGGAVYRFT